MQSPVTASYYNKCENNDEADSLFASRGPYYNFNKLQHLPDSLFYDDEHLNQKGVEKFDKNLLEVVYKRENKSARKL